MALWTQSKIEGLFVFCFKSTLNFSFWIPMLMGKQKKTKPYYLIIQAKLFPVFPPLFDFTHLYIDWILAT